MAVRRRIQAAHRKLKTLKLDQDRWRVEREAAERKRRSEAEALGVQLCPTCDQAVGPDEHWEPPAFTGEAAEALQTFAEVLADLEPRLSPCPDCGQTVLNWRCASLEELQRAEQALETLITYDPEGDSEEC